MERACPACGAPVTITRYHTALRCPWCHNTLYTTPRDSVLFFQISPALSCPEAEKSLFRALRRRGIGTGLIKITSRSSLDLVFMKSPGDKWISCGEEIFLELEGFVPQADRVTPLDPRETPSLHLAEHDSPCSLYLVPFTLFRGTLEGHPVRILVDNVTGKVYTADLPDIFSRRRIRHNRTVLLFLIIASFTLAFFTITLPLLFLLILTALFFLGLILLKGG